ncbi:restriction endonuclease subunit S [Rahnella sp. CFA14(1/10)]|uniref:restriction endonuclease subunit S n=1 Tax=Rahnella sp. CFA14(1/10) TaxID=2511203 RepID=UPI001020F17B|nr:restriction endonuclease subunit S [Rahnella sp. CFA14(1/10)]
MAKYKAYPEYKDSGVEWLGDVPEHWIICRLKNLATIKNGHDYKSVQAEQGYPVMGSGGQFTFASKFMYNKASVLLGRKGTIDKPLYINEPFWTVDTMYYTELHNGVDAKYLYYQALTIQFSRYSTNTALPSMTQEHLSNYYFTVPNQKLERKQIAAFLDHETAKIDNLIEKQQQLIELLKEKRQAVISHAVTKGLNPNVAMRDSGVEWLGEVPEHWDVAKLSFNYEVLLGKMLDDKKITGKYLGHYLRNTDVQWDQINTEELPTMDFKLEERERYSVKKGDLLVCEGGEIGRSAIWNSETPCFYQKALHRLRPLSNNSKTRFMFYVLYDAVKQGRFISGAGKATIAHLPAEAFKQYKFAFPPLAEQINIAKVLDSYSELFNELEEKTTQQISLLQERRTALISAAVTGKIDVRDWVAPDTSHIEESEEATA